METYRVSLENKRWFLVEASSPAAARVEAQCAFPEQADKIAKIEADWETDFDPKLHIDC